MNQIHYINGAEVKPPQNFAELSIELNFDTDSDEKGISVTRFDWINEEAALLLGLYKAGLTGGGGVFVGVPHQIKVVENGLDSMLFDGFIDLSSADFDRNRVSADSTPFASPEFINEKADGFSMEQLFVESGGLTKADNVFIPYIINSIPNYTQAFLVVLTLTFIVVELKKLTTDLTQKSVESATYIDSVGGVVGLIFKIIYGVLLLLTIVELLLNLADLIIQKVKYKPSMQLNRLLAAGAEHVGLIYESAFLQTDTWNKCHIIPESVANPETQSDNRIKGYFKPNDDEQHGYFNGTYGDLLRAVKEMFNARIVIGDGKLKIVPLLKTATAGTFRLKPYYNREFQTNAGSLVSNYNILFRYDSNDRNTIDNWTGNNMTSFLEVTGAVDKKLKLTKGFRQVNVPFARGIRKDRLNAIEKIMDAILEGLDPIVGALISIANAVIKVINAIFAFVEDMNKKLKTIGISIDLGLPEIEYLKDPKLGELLDNRVGMLLLETDFITVPKIVMLDVQKDAVKTKLAAENATHIKALYLYNNFHYTNSFKAGTKSAQRVRLNFKNVEMNLAEFTQVQKEGLVKLADGTVADVISCQYNPAKRLAEMRLEKRVIYANNLTETISEGEGR